MDAFLGEKSQDESTGVVKKHVLVDWESHVVGVDGGDSELEGAFVKHDHLDAQNLIWHQGSITHCESPAIVKLAKNKLVRRNMNSLIKVIVESQRMLALLSTY